MNLLASSSHFDVILALLIKRCYFEIDQFIETKCFPLCISCFVLGLCAALSHVRF